MLADITSFQPNGMSQAQLASSGESTGGEGGGLGGLGGRLLLLCCIFLASLQDWGPGLASNGDSRDITGRQGPANQ